MAEWTIVILLVLFGLALVIVEVIFIPGTTIVGVAGFISIVVGIILSFRYFGAEIGWYSLAGATVVAGGVIYLAFRTNVWRRFAINTSIDSRVNEVELSKFVVGLEGVALSALRPIGKGEFGSDIIEVRTNGEYVEAGSRIQIIKVTPNNVIVEIISNQ